MAAISPRAELLGGLPRALGVDEWAWRKGRRYDTVLDAVTGLRRG
jgi:hypothetical protein